MKGYIKGLDGLRAVAIIWVMFGHVSPSLNWESTTFYHKAYVLFSNSNWVGVQLFFVLSGYLITKILIEGRGTDHQLKNFFIRRSLRIFPVYYFTLAVVFILVPIISETPTWLESVTDNQIWFWTYLNNWARPFFPFGGLTHLWSLAIEEQFYLFWPFVVIFLSNRRVVDVCLFMIISAPLIRFALYYNPEFFNLTVEQGARATYNFTFARWDALALGALLAVIMTQKDCREMLAKIAKPSLIIVTFVIAFQVYINHNFTSVDAGIGLLNQTTASLAFVLILYFVVSNNAVFLTRILEVSWFKKIGKYSYAMYIFHLPLMMLWLELARPDLSGYSALALIPVIVAYNIAFIAINFCIAAISWHLLEYPFLKLKHKFER